MNSLDYSVGLTLSVGGTLVTGKLISPQEYFQAIGKQLEAAFAKGGLSPEVSRQVGEFIQSRGEAATPSEELLKAAEKAAIAADVLPISGNQRAYIHLKDAGILTPSTGARMSLSGAYWRGRIAAVESFIIGEANEASRTRRASSAASSPRGARHTGPPPGATVAGSASAPTCDRLGPSAAPTSTPHGRSVR